MFEKATANKKDTTVEYPLLGTSTNYIPCLMNLYYR